MFGPKGICEDCSVALAPWGWNHQDRREVCSQCRIARALESLLHFHTGEY